MTSTKREGAEIHWGDETGLRSDDVRGRSYAAQGQTPVIRANNKRHGLSVISCVANEGQMRWEPFDGALNSDILIDFMRRLVKAWLAQPRHEIEAFCLAGYSPELNPKRWPMPTSRQAVTTLAPARTKLQLVKATSRHLRSVQRQPERVNSYFQHAPVRYAA